LRSQNGDEFSLRVAGYQFPDITDSEYDSNWLDIDISCRVDGRSWGKRNPSLLTWELDNLIGWLRAISASEKLQEELRFLEPCLHFSHQERRPNLVSLRVHFAAEYRPPWSIPAEDIWAEIVCTPRELLAWAEELGQERDRFPPRAGVGSGHSGQGRDYCSKG
jgi:hypothetical protein